MKVRLAIVLFAIGCNGEGSQGGEGAQGEPGSPGATGSPGAAGSAGVPGSSAILLVTDEVTPPVIQSPGHGPGWPPTGECPSEPHSFTTTTGHILVQRADSNSVSIDESTLISYAGTSTQAHPLLLATHVTPNVPHTIAAFSGTRPVDNWRHGTCTSDELARSCETMAGDNPQCWCPPTACPTQGTILVTELP